MDSHSRRSMFLRLVAKSVFGRGSRVATAVAAVALAATVTAALGNLQLSLREKLQRQLAVFGPNIWIEAPVDHTFSWSRLRKIGQRLYLDAAPYLLKKQQILVQGTWLTVSSEEIVPAEQRKMNGWWQVRGHWPIRADEVLVGADLARSLRLSTGNHLAIETRGRSLQIAGVATTGSKEDGMLILPLVGDSISGAQVRAPGDSSRVEALADRLRQELGGISAANAGVPSVHVLQRVAQADTIILKRLETVFGLLGLVIVLASGLCVSTTFSTMVNQRAREIGLQKALGATDSEVVSLFWGEALCLGSLGTLLGYLAGIGFAAWMGQSVFQSPVTPQLLVLPAVLVVAIGMTLVAAVPAARRIARLEPAYTLKGSPGDF